MPTLTQPQAIYFVILIVSFAILISERLRNDITALLIVLALYVTGLLSSGDALSGFSSEPAVVVASVFVMSEALRVTGLSDTAGRWIAKLAGSSPGRALAVIMPSVSLLSAFTHHVTTTAAMLPVVLNLSREKDIPASKLLMPLSFAASLGTTITLIGAPAFLLASDILARSGRPPLGIFSIAPIGLAISAAGALFMLLFGRFLLPSHPGAQDPGERFRLDDYFTEATILPDSPLAGRALRDAEAGLVNRLDVVGWLREGRRLRPPYADRTLAAGDVLMLRASPEDIVTIRQEPGIGLRPVEKYVPQSERGADGGEDGTVKLVQVVVAPASTLINRTIASVDFRRRYGAIVVGIWRQRGFIDRELSDVHLRGGDVLVLEGDDESLNRVSNDSAFLMMVPFQGEVQSRRRARLAGLIMLGVVLIASFNLMTLEMAMLAGAVAMVLTRCLTPRQGYRAIDYRIFVFIAGAVPLGIAMDRTGSSKVLAGMFQAVVGGWNEVAVLFVLFLLVGVATQFLSDAATVAVFAPVGLALAQALHQSPEAYVVTVAMGAVAAFFTPIGHHGNLIVYGPGRYQFSDFVKVGTPLTVVIGVLVAVLAPLLWH